MFKTLAIGILLGMLVTLTSFAEIKEAVSNSSGASALTSAYETTSTFIQDQLDKK
jgi:hypothetical protein